MGNLTNNSRQNINLTPESQTRTPTRNANQLDRSNKSINNQATKRETLKNATDLSNASNNRSTKKPDPKNHQLGINYKLSPSKNKNKSPRNDFSNDDTKKP